MKKYLQVFFEQAMGRYLKKIKYIKTGQDVFERMAEVAAATNTIY